LTKECGRCGQLFREDHTPTYAFYVRHANMQQKVELCPDCMKQIENWYIKKETALSSSPTR